MDALTSTTSAELYELVRAAVGEALTARRCLVLFTGAALGYRDAVEQLRALSAQGAQLTYTQTTSARQVLDQELMRSVGMVPADQSWLGDAGTLIVATMTANAAAKAARGIADCHASSLMAEAIKQGLTVVAVTSGADPESPEMRRHYPKMPAAYAEAMRADLASLAGFGVRLATAQNLRDVVCAAWGATAPPDLRTESPGRLSLT